MLAFYLVLIELLISEPSAGQSAVNQGQDPRTYITGFDNPENPLSEGGNWINGKTNGYDWSNVSSLDGHAVGHQKGDIHYVDATALLNGSWGSDQAVRATVFAGITYPEDYPEVELRLRSSLSAHHCSGYEIAFSAAGKNERAYLIIVRWNGPVGDFTYLKELKGPEYGVVSGDVIQACIRGNIITAYLNGRLVGLAADSVYSSGCPGIGFNFDWAGNEHPAGDNGSYGFDDFSASDNPAGFP